MDDRGAEGDEKNPTEGLGFLLLSGVTTGMSWLCYYRALQDGPASVVVPVDKLSILVTVLFSRLVLKETLERRALVGLLLILAGTGAMLLCWAGRAKKKPGEHGPRFFAQVNALTARWASACKTLQIKGQGSFKAYAVSGLLAQLGGQVDRTLGIVYRQLNGVRQSKAIHQATQKGAAKHVARAVKIALNSGVGGIADLAGGRIVGGSAKVVCAKIYASQHDQMCIRDRPGASAKRQAGRKQSARF